jgi:hypothetical protein
LVGRWETDEKVKLLEQEIELLKSEKAMHPEFTKYVEEAWMLREKLEGLEGSQMASIQELNEQLSAQVKDLLAEKQILITKLDRHRNQINPLQCNLLLLLACS